MIEVKGDIWKLWEGGHFIVIPTNGFVKNNGEAVMGRGLAYDAKIKFPKLPYELGELLKKYGNDVFIFRDYRIFTFPVKHKWDEKADIELIKFSAIGLRNLVALWVRSKKLVPPVYIPRVGCGNGRLDWKDVKPILESCLDENFQVVSNE